MLPFLFMEDGFVIKNGIWEGVLSQYWAGVWLLNPEISEPGKVIIGLLVLMNNSVKLRHFVP